MSRTDRLRQPMTTVIGVTYMWGPRGIRPAVPFIPTSPQNAAGMRIEPPPSPPVASGTSPPATADALPADDPPGVRAGFHGLPVTPVSYTHLTLPTIYSV